MAIFPEPTNYSTSLDEIVAYNNTVTNGSFTVVILMLLWIIMFISLKNYDTKIAATTASFITMMIAILLRAGNLITDTVLIVAITLNVISAVILYLMHGYEY